jgi:hypothetical protein
MRKAAIAQNQTQVNQHVQEKGAIEVLSPAQKRQQEGNQCIMRGLAISALGIGMEVAGNATLLLTDYTWTGAAITALGLPVTAVGISVTFTGYLYQSINIVHTAVGASATIAAETANKYGFKTN